MQLVDMFIEARRLSSCDRFILFAHRFSLEAAGGPFIFLLLPLVTATFWSFREAFMKEISVRLNRGLLTVSYSGSNPDQ